MSRSMFRAASRYATLMPGRTLERQGRDAEAVPYLRMAAAMPGDAEPTGPAAAV